MSINKGRMARAVGTGLLSPLLTGGVLLLAYALFGLYPFGEQSIAWCDMNQQVIPLMAEFRSVLLGNGSMFLSGGAGGVNFWGIFFFFLASPFSLLSVFCPLSGLPWLMNWMVLWKMMVCAGTASLFFRRVSGQQEKVLPALLGLAYAFSGYAMFYYQNIVWLDMMALFPLLLLSLLSLEKSRKILPFILAFSGMLAVNYYLSYMAVIFLLLGYGLYQFFCGSQQRRGDRILLLGCGAVLSLLMTAVIWLPSLLEVLTSARGEGLFQSLSAGSLRAEIFTTLPVIMTSALPFAALLFLRKKELKTGVFTAAAWMCLLFFIAMTVRPINKMWHTGSYQGFPVRYGYMAALLLLFLAWRILRSAEPDRFPRRSAKLPAAVTLIAAAGLVAFQLFLLANCSETLSAYTSTLWGDRDSFLLLLAALAVGAAAYAVWFWAYRGGMLTRRLSLCLLALLIGGECIFNSGVYMGTVGTSHETYQNAVQLAGKIPEEGFYRVKTQRKYFDVNLFSAMGYESLSHYTSLTPETTLVSQRRLGYSGYWMEVNSNGGTAFADALLGNRYEIVPRSELGAEELSSADTVYCGPVFAIKRLTYRLPDAVVTDAEPGFLEDLPAGSRAEIQGAVAESLFPDSEGLFTIFQPDSLEGVTLSDGSYYLKGASSGFLPWNQRLDRDMLLYFDCASPPSNALNEQMNKSCKVSVNGRVIRDQYPTQSDNGILNLGEFEAGDIVRVTVELSKNIQPESFEVFGVDTGLLETLCQNANGGEIQGDGGRRTIVCTAEEGQSLFVPFSYDTGWKAVVNGKEVPISRAAGNYLSLPLEAGENIVELSYTPPGFTAGLWISIGGLVLFFLFFRFGKKWISARMPLKQGAALLFTAAAIGVAFMVYFFPLIVYMFGNI